MRDPPLYEEDSLVYEQITVLEQVLENIIVRSFNTDGKGDLLQLTEELNEKSQEYAKFSSLLNLKNPAGIRGSDNFPGKREAWIILLPSSIDRLGLYIYASLLDNPRVKDIYCFSTDPKQHLQHLKAMDLGGFGTRVHFLETKDITKPRFGLRDDTVMMHLLEAHPTHIIVPCWQEPPPSFSKFEPVVNTIQAFLEFCSELLHDEPPEVIFLESFLCIPNLLRSSKINGNLVPERRFTEASFSWCTYIEASYYVTEMLLQSVTWVTNADVSTKIIRFGDVFEPLKRPSFTTSGTINEWFSAIITASNKLKALPETLGRLEKVQWIPIDVLGQIITDIMADEGSVRNSDPILPAETKVYHVQNPHVTTWSSDILPLAKEELSISEVVPLPNWINKLKQDNHGGNAFLQSSFMHLDQFLDDTPAPATSSCTIQQTIGPVLDLTFDTANAVNCSKTFRDLEPIEAACLRDLIKRLASSS